MNVTLIRPNIGRLEHSLFVDEARMEPLSLGVIAALTPRDVDLVLHDDRIEDIPYDEPADLAAITVETFTARRAYEISSEYRKRGVPVIMGGIHPTLAPREAKEHCDSVYTGDAEHLWGQTTMNTAAAIQRENFDPNICVVSIGMAGENLVRFGNLITDLGRAAGRTGQGAVFGSKRLKAVAVRGS